jgi:hypothetical protein
MAGFGIGGAEPQIRPAWGYFLNEVRCLRGSSHIQYACNTYSSAIPSKVNTLPSSVLS